MDSTQGSKMQYEHPEVRDFGDLIDITAAGQLGGSEDGGAKQIEINVDPIAQVTVQVFP